jgi:hypothetical protein
VGDDKAGATCEAMKSIIHVGALELYDSDEALETIWLAKSRHGMIPDSDA